MGRTIWYPTRTSVVMNSKSATMGSTASRCPKSRGLTRSTSVTSWITATVNILKLRPSGMTVGPAMVLMDWCTRTRTSKCVDVHEEVLGTHEIPLEQITLVVSNRYDDSRAYNRKTIY